MQIFNLEFETVHTKRIVKCPYINLADNKRMHVCTHMCLTLQIMTYPSRKMLISRIVRGQRTGAVTCLRTLQQESCRMETGPQLQSTF